MRLLAVNHHYFRSRAGSGGIYPISPIAFETEINALARKWRIASQGDVIKALAAPTPDTSLCLITFDDGLKEQMAAAHHLAKASLGGVFFVSTAPLIERRVLEVHKLHLIRSTKSDSELRALLLSKFGGLFNRVDLDVARKQYRYDEDGACHVKYFINFVLDPQARREWCEEMFAEIVGNEGAAADALYMSKEDLAELSRLDMIGTHAHSHSPLATLSHEAIGYEIQTSLGILRDCGIRNIRGISYPYGGPSAINEIVANVARTSGLGYGFTMTRGVNTEVDLDNLMLLKRISTSDYKEYC